MSDNLSRPAKSYADIRGEWEERKIPVAGAVKSFISHLKIGQDLTKVSLPSIFLRPYSMLEEFGSRSLSQFHLLLKASSQESSLDRIKSVLKWFLSCTKDEAFNHKPLNPILGEEHICKFDHEDGSTTYYLAEQVSHHPPMTGIRLENDKHKISVDGAYSFNIIFRPNSLTVATNGRLQISVGDEVYILEKPYPDMLINNTIMGKKSVAWVGKISIQCPSTGWVVELNYDLNKDNVKVVDGSIMNLEKSKLAKGELNTYYIGGKCGYTIYISPNELKYTHKDAAATYVGSIFKTLIETAGYSKDAEKTPEGDVFVDLATEPHNVPVYPNEDLLPANSSIAVWKEVIPPIIAYDLEKADEIKRKIEEKQRAKRAQLEEAKEEFRPAYFVKDGKKDHCWQLNPEYVWKLTTIFPSP